MGGRRGRIVAITGVVGAPSMACDALSELMHCNRRHFFKARLSCNCLLLVNPKSVWKGNEPKERMGDVNEEEEIWKMQIRSPDKRGQGTK